MEGAPDAGRVHADPAQMQQVLLNLAINARDAMPGGGILAIRTYNEELGSELASRHKVRPGAYVVLAVADTGTGMDATTRKRAFEPFFTTKPQGKGTGLGLSTIYTIVKQSGGIIDLHTVLGEGTTFKVYMPRVQDETTKESPQIPEPAGGHETVLVVEDEEAVRHMVHTALERRGYHVLIAGNGPEALEVSRHHEGPIDLLITDMVMPHMNGRELGKILSAERPGVAILFISGYPGNSLHSKGAAQATFLPKPFTPVALTAKVREILDNRRKRASESARKQGR
jgi:CheY-like chemotaxis protein